MSQVESYLVERNGKSVIASSKILDIMLTDYHKSRELNLNKDHKMFINNNPEMFDNELAKKNEGNDLNKENKINYFKQLTFDYIKEKELDR